MVLDLVEVAELHSSVNLGISFVNVLKTFGVEQKVRVLNSYQRGLLTCVVHCRYLALLVIMPPTMIQ